MKSIVVGGNFGGDQKASGVARKLAQSLQADIHNGGDIEALKNIDISGYELIVWMPNVSNDEEKTYPTKPKGSVMFVSKFLHGDCTEVDAITRIFKMNGNAVIAIIKSKDKYLFKLIDALGNVWSNTYEIGLLAERMKDLTEWTCCSLRKGTRRYQPEFLRHLVELNKKVADEFEQVKGRYFGNVSTRCLKMFPSARTQDDTYFFSRRNCSKKRLELSDMVMVNESDGQMFYHGIHKPSVDTPVQIEIYKDYPDVNFMIHGHTYIKNVPFTSKYYPCGDIREAVALRNENPGDRINLLNHGFLMLARDIDHLRTIVDECELIERTVGFEKVYSRL